MKGGAGCHSDEVGKAPIRWWSSTKTLHLQEVREAVLRSGNARQAGQGRRSRAGGGLSEQGQVSLATLGKWLYSHAPHHSSRVDLHPLYTIHN